METAPKRQDILHPHGVTECRGRAGIIPASYSLHPRFKLKADSDNDVHRVSSHFHNLTSTGVNVQGDNRMLKKHKIKNEKSKKDFRAMFVDFIPL